jgi:outer membrane protein TolC
LAWLLALLAGAGGGTALRAQEAAPVALTLKRAVELALENSRDIQLAKIQTSLAQRSAYISRAEFLPNLYAGSGLGYTNGIPETPGGRAPSIFSITYRQQVLNQPLKGQARELQEQVKAQTLTMEEVRDSVIQRTAAAYLELAKVRHSLELLRKERVSAQQIVDVTRQRQAEGLELPIEVIKAQLTSARIEQRILELEGRQDELEVFLRGQIGLAPEQPLEVTAEELPAEAEQEGANLVALALQNNTGLRQAEADRRAKEFRLRGEKGGRWPALELVSVYSVLGKFNNYLDFFKTFQRNNFNFGLQLQVPIFSARTKANIDLAKVNLEVTQTAVSNKRADLSADVRVKTHRLRELDAAKEVARLELQLAQQNLGVLQVQFAEGRVNLRDVEKARLDENERWMQYLDANFQRQQAQLELLRTTGQLAKAFR